MIIGRLKTTSTKPNQLLQENQNQALKFLGKLLIVGILAIFLNSIRWIPNNVYVIEDVFSVISLFLLIAGASFAIGTFGGFIFGIPRQETFTIDEAKSKKLPIHMDNDNLVQISDWLTKILVGVGLTQLHQIGPLLIAVGEYLAVDTKGVDPVSEILSITLVIYFLVCGFLMSYLWTRLYFKKQLGLADRDYNDLYKEVDEVKEDLGKLMIGIPKPKFKSFDQSKKIDEMTNVEGTSENLAESLEDDFQKGKWGGQSNVNDRSLTATITESKWGKDYFDIELTVQSLNPDIILRGKVKFHLHPTFRNMTPEVKVVNGQAKLNIIGWGAFTVGAQSDNDTVALELDLASIKSAPKLFLSR